MKDLNSAEYFTRLHQHLLKIGIEPVRAYESVVSLATTEAITMQQRNTGRCELIFADRSALFLRWGEVYAETIGQTLSQVSISAIGALEIREDGSRILFPEQE